MRQSVAGTCRLAVVVVVLFAIAVASGVVQAQGAPERPSAGDAGARGGIRFCCTAQGTEYLARGGRRIRLPKGVTLWSPDRRLFTWVLHDGRGNDLLGVTDVRGRKRVLVKARRFRGLSGKFVVGAVAWSPDSKRILYGREFPAGDETGFQSFTISVAGGGETPLSVPSDVQEGGPVLWSPTENLIAWDVSRLAPGGGRLEAFTWLVNPDSATQPQRIVAGSPVAWSPDGRKIAVDINPLGLHVVDVATGAAALVFPGTFWTFGDWAPDSRRLALTVQSRRIDKEDIRIVNVDGTRRYDPTRTPKRSSDFTPVWSPDGRRLAFVRNYSAGLDFSGPLSEQPRFKPQRTLVVAAKGGRPRPLRPLQSGEAISDWR